jgi:hypothetical protein
LESQATSPQRINRFNIYRQPHPCLLESKNTAEDHATRTLIPRSRFPAAPACVGRARCFAPGLDELRGFSVPTTCWPSMSQIPRLPCAYGAREHGHCRLLRCLSGCRSGALARGKHGREQRDFLGRASVQLGHHRLDCLRAEFHRRTGHCGQSGRVLVGERLRAQCHHGCVLRNDSTGGP